MRGIRFRGIGIKTKEMKFGHIVETKNGIFIVNNINCDPNSINYYPVKADTIGQYTGLKDKNGKEIYEGDITKSCEGYARQVVWKDNSWKYYWKVKKSYQGESYFQPIHNDLGDTNSKRFGDEIIGNIYENLNLLKEA